jgi:hypothetical protein
LAIGGKKKRTMEEGKFEVAVKRLDKVYNTDENMHHTNSVNSESIIVG